jgi:hypothetical protein
MRAYGNVLEDVRPTLRNKPSGLKADWCSAVSKSSIPHQSSTTHTRSISSSSSSTFPTYTRSISSSSSSTFPTSPMVPQSPALEFDHMSSLLAISPPAFSKSYSPPSFRRNPVLLINENATAYQEPRHSNTVFIFVHLVHSDLKLIPLVDFVASRLQGRKRPETATRPERSSPVAAREFSQPLYSTCHRAGVFK